MGILDILGDDRFIPDLRQTTYTYHTMNKILEVSKTNVEGVIQDAVGYESIDEKHRKQEVRESGDVTVLDTDEYFPTFARESKAQKNVRRDSKRAREDLNDFNVDSSL